MMNNSSRRRFLQIVGLGGISAILPCEDPARAQDRSADPQRFFIQFYLPGGWDPTYFFDSRPKAMTDAGLQHRYVDGEPPLWEGENGESTWIGPAAEPLRPFRKDFSVLNGVIMSPAFDGHEQNESYLLTGNPFGGEYFLPHLNRESGAAKRALLDGIQSGVFNAASPTNMGGVVPLSAASAAALVARLKTSPALNPGGALYRYLATRYADRSAGSGRFSLGARRLGSAWQGVPELATALSAVRVPEDPSEDSRFLQVVLESFRLGVARTAVIVIEPRDRTQVDTHDPTNAKAAPRILAELTSRLAKMIDILKSTPFEGPRSFQDVTTWLACSEFGRTMRQKSCPLNATGTDHNPLCNSVLLGGRGIQGGWVIGKSDWQTPSEPLSKAHRERDSEGIKLMGRPFNYSKLQPRADLPENYLSSDYLNIAAIVNTIYSLFGVPKSAYREPARDAGQAPVLEKLLRA